jgi:cobalt/nickel transport system permease protein
MHIPDSILSPSTCAAAGLAMTPVWTLAARRVRRDLGTRQVPLLALGAAFCFTIMMFNIPAPGGTTAHPIAGTLLAVVLGPWAACIGISVALLIQALFFGDGGLLAYGANCFTMAFVMPFVGYSVYRLTCGGTAGRIGNPISACLGAFVAINAAALTVAVMLGIQPVLFHEPNGHALFFPFGLHVTIPAMLSTHLIVAGPAEAIVTGLVVRYLRTAGIALYGDPKSTEHRGSGLNDAAGVAPGTRTEVSANAIDRKRNDDGGKSVSATGRRLSRPLGGRFESLAIGLLALLALTPLGLLAKGEAWGEWDSKGVAAQTEQQFGPAHAYVPREIAAAEGHTYGGIPALQDYASGDGKNRLGYFGAGLLGAASVLGLTLAAGRMTLQRRRGNGVSTVGRRVSVPHHLTYSPVDPLTPSASSAGGAPLSPFASSPHHLITSSDLPDWLRQSAPAASQPGSTRRTNRFVERTLAELTAASAASFQSERMAHENGLLQGLDARGKIVSMLALILATCLSHRPIVLVGLYILALLLAVSSQVPLLQIIRRVWLAAPLFAAAVALPLVFNNVTPGQVILTLWTHPQIAISKEGIVLAAVITLRIATTISFALLLTLTTRWTVLLVSLRTMWFPRTFLQVLAMTYRYLAIALQTAADAFLARKSRTVGSISDREGRGFVGLRIGALLSKSLALSEEVHSAMLSRGFRGEMRALAHSQWRAADLLLTLALLLPAIVAVALR